MFNTVINISLLLQVVTINSNPSLTPKNQEDIFIPSRRYCGYQHSDDYSSKSQGADITEFPWLVGFYYKFKSGVEKINCQGTVINARYILTAAHCVKVRPNVSLKSIRLGEYNIKNSTDCTEFSGLLECSDAVQEYGAEEIIIHPLFEERPHTKYDIALVRLNQTISTYTDYIRPICLPTLDIDLPQLGDTIVTTGWGTFSTSSNTDVKKKVLNKLITNENCASIYKIYGGIVIPLLENQMCTQEVSDNVESACAGDSGGPLMFSHKSQWYIVGVNSYTSTKCGDKYPIVHTRVSKFMDWIRESMKPW